MTKFSTPLDWLFMGQRYGKSAKYSFKLPPTINDELFSYFNTWLCELYIVMYLFEIEFSFLCVTGHWILKNEDIQDHSKDTKGNDSSTPNVRFDIFN